MRGIGINKSNLLIPDYPEIIGELLSPIQFYEFIIKVNGIIICDYKYKPE